ncbi:MAG: hypothetical protein U1G07_07050 [Verrucomicrobiota bacterium]
MIDTVFYRRWQRLCWVALLLTLAGPITFSQIALPSVAGSKNPGHLYTEMKRPTTGDLRDDALPGGGTVAVRRGEVLVRFKRQSSAIRRQSLAQSLGGRVEPFRAPRGAVALQGEAGAISRSAFEDLAVVQLDGEADIARALVRLRQHPDVLYAELDYRLQLTEDASESVTPNDFDFAQLWGSVVHNVGQGDVAAPERISRRKRELQDGEKEILVAGGSRGLTIIIRFGGGTSGLTCVKSPATASMTMATGSSMTCMI